MTLLEIPGNAYIAIRHHLFPVRSHKEQVAFIYANAELVRKDTVFRFLEWQHVTEEGFEFHSRYHLELTDEMRAAVIKRAHDLQASLVEFHTHDGSWEAEFSKSDMAGFAEFVPHVVWRLRGRPYGAIVMTDTGFDGLAWLRNPHTPERLHGIKIDGKFNRATGLTDITKRHDGPFR
ncbi:MAG: hypothetical protein HY435_03245 [Candidatus Liptonbacteria bacterium]|nr:hypothetical protein [Candidatus Liptonbacteria bacterium]